uniref:cDNA FLJ36021 fis, clone TESTI2016568 n=1 Tax=Homo sapiens TaxID=9606 RepID=Q8N9Z5_HUMAN|nr:unnamed protein product [Homo sapiens]
MPPGGKYEVQQCNRPVLLQGNPVEMTAMVGDFCLNYESDLVLQGQRRLGEFGFSRPNRHSVLGLEVSAVRCCHRQSHLNSSGQPVASDTHYALEGKQLSAWEQLRMVNSLGKECSEAKTLNSRNRSAAPHFR